MEKSFPTTHTAQCHYVPKIVDKEILASKKFTEMGNYIISKLNEKKNLNLSFQQVLEADCEKSHVCSGCFYFMKILSKDELTKATSTFSIMVWNGSSYDILPRSPGVVDSSHATPYGASSVSESKIRKMVTLASSGNNESEKKKLRTSDVYVHTLLRYQDAPKEGSGHIMFTKYNLYFAPKEEPAKGVSIPVIHRKWCYTLDESLIQSLRRKVLKPDDLFKKNHPLIYPPLRKRKKFDDDTPPSTTVELLEMDFCSPMILSCAWCAIEDYNFKKEANLKLVKVLKALKTDCAGVSFNITLKVKDGKVPKTFNASVWLRPWMKSVNVVSSLTEEEVPKQLHHYKRRKTVGSSSISAVDSEKEWSSRMASADSRMVSPGGIGGSTGV